jgi:iron complex outermembrane receptor protein
VRFDEVSFDVTDRFLSDGDDSGKRSLRNTSPMLGLNVGLGPSTSLYASYGVAFETPTTTEFNRPDGGGGFNASLDPQRAESLEVGFRGALGERNRYEVAVYGIDVDDELIPFEVPGSPGRDFYENAGQSRRNGIELSWQSDPTDRIAAVFSYTYSDFEFERFVSEDGDDFAGNRLPGTVEHLLFGELGYTHPQGWFGVVNALYAGEQFADNANTAVTPSYTLMTLRLGFEREINGIVLSPFLGVNNLLDETYFANVRINAFGGRYFEPGPERHLYGGLSLRRAFR